MKKRGQIQSQFVIYILAIIIMGLLLLFGYKVIKNMGEKQEQVNTLQLRSSIKADIDSIDIGSIKIRDYDVPNKITHLCFISDCYGPQCSSGSSAITVATTGVYSLLAAASEGNKEDNFYLIGDTVYGYDNIGRIILNLEEFAGAATDLYSACIPVKNGKAKLKLEGIKDGAMISDVTES